MTTDEKTYYSASDLVTIEELAVFLFDEVKNRTTDYYGATLRVLTKSFKKPTLDFDVEDLINEDIVDVVKKYIKSRVKLERTALNIRRHIIQHSFCSNAWTSVGFDHGNIWG